jgi:hypothetical protein
MNIETHDKIADNLRRIVRACEMRAGIMRDPARTGGWAGAEKRPTNTTGSTSARKTPWICFWRKTCGRVGHEAKKVSEFQRNLDASVTAEQAAEYVRKERERNTNRDKPIPWPKDGFINDYD